MCEVKCERERSRAGSFNGNLVMHKYNWYVRGL